jgi:hypothetical protein
LKAGVPGIRYLDEGSREIGAWKVRADELQRERKMQQSKIGRDYVAGRLGTVPPANRKKWDDYRKERIASIDQELAALNAKMASYKPTHNYVVFDPKTLAITHRNGQPLTQGEANDAMMALDDFNPSEPRKPAGSQGGGEWNPSKPAGGKRGPRSEVNLDDPHRRAAAAWR